MTVGRLAFRAVGETVTVERGLIDGKNTSVV
jgi:hypothetical protein